MPDETLPGTVQIDIVSDVVCPWCIVAYKQLEQALAETGATARLRWHPFELNPDMPPQGQNLRDHLIGKYAITPEQSRQARDRLTEIGASLGFDFAYSDASRMVNTFAAHQLLDWAEAEGRQHPLKLALFRAYFTLGRDISEPEVLVDVAAGAGLDRDAARAALASGAHVAPVRENQRFWLQAGVRAVPGMVFGGKYLLTGAQGAQTYGLALRRCLDANV